MHLVWKPAAIGTFVKFMDSYRRHPAGVKHDLLLVYKGFRSTREVSDYRRLLQGLPHSELFVSDLGFDITAYFTVASRRSSPYLCFLNDYAEILADGWLKALREHGSKSGVGAVAATGSWESFYTTYALGLRPVRSRFMVDGIARRLKRRWMLACFRSRFQPAPNPHLRTNGLFIKRDIMLRLKRGQLRSKMDTWRFESGRRGMTPQILGMDFDVLVVGRDGRAYERERWRESQTFRSGGQRNLLIADNRTREYAEADSDEKRRLEVFAWGDNR